MINRSSNASRLVDKLEEKKLVRRTACKTNRRQVDIIITSKGLGLLSKIDARPAVWELLKQKISSAQARQLNALLDAIRS
jgi:DNA-binding MarR family transcriptional regulator